jgi:hypothetical protein
VRDAGVPRAHHLRPGNLAVAAANARHDLKCFYLFNNHGSRQHGNDITSW